MNLSEAKHVGHNNTGQEYDEALRRLSSIEQEKPCTCQRKAKNRQGSALYPSLITVEDADPDCELHFPWVIEDPDERAHAVRWWFAGYQVGYDTASPNEEPELEKLPPGELDPRD